jgi:hypothetical protein
LLEAKDWDRGRRQTIRRDLGKKEPFDINNKNTFVAWSLLEMSNKFT